MQPLAFSTNAFKKSSLGEAIETIGLIGYGAVELMADLHHAYPPRFDRQHRQATLDQLANRGLAVSNVNAFTHFVDGDTYHPTWIEPDPAARRRRVEHTIACIDLAAEFGAKTVSIQPGGPMIGRSELTYDQAAEIFAEELSRCVEPARRRGVTIAVEPEPGLLIQSADEYLAFKRRFFAHEDAVRMNCDIGHLFCVGDDPGAVIRAMPEEISHVHLEDIGADRVHQHLTPGKGVIDFDDVFAALRDIDYPGRVTVELYPYETTAAGVAKAAWEHLQRKTE